MKKVSTKNKKYHQNPMPRIFCRLFYRNHRRKLNTSANNVMEETRHEWIRPIDFARRQMNEAETKSRVGE